MGEKKSNNQMQGHTLPKNVNTLYCAGIEDSPYKFAQCLLRGNNGLQAEIMKSHREPLSTWRQL